MILLKSSCAVLMLEPNNAQETWGNRNSRAWLESTLSILSRRPCIISQKKCRVDIYVHLVKWFNCMEDTVWDQRGCKTAIKCFCAAFIDNICLLYAVLLYSLFLPCKSDVLI